MNLRYNKKVLLVIGSITILLLAAFTIFISDPAGSKIDSTDREGESSDFRTQAAFTNGKDIFLLVGGDARFDALSKDIFYFGKKTYKKYENTTGYVGFEVTSDIKKEGDNLSFKGRFGAGKNTITVKIILLKNDKLKISITDTKTKKNIDDMLPSNSKRNQLIGQLPFKKPGYNISYLSAEDSFLVTISDADTTKAQQESLAYLRSELGVTSLNTERVSLIVWDKDGIPKSFPNPDLN